MRYTLLNNIEIKTSEVKCVIVILSTKKKKEKIQYQKLTESSTNYLGQSKRKENFRRELVAAYILHKETQPIPCVTQVCDIHLGNQLLISSSLFYCFVLYHRNKQSRAFPVIPILLMTVPNLFRHM